MTAKEFLARFKGVSTHRLELAVLDCSGLDVRNCGKKMIAEVWERANGTKLAYESDSRLRGVTLEQIAEALRKRYG